MASKTTTLVKRNCSIISTCCLLILSFVSVATETTISEVEACGYWKKLASDISKKKSQMYCSANSTDPCTQLKCQGTYKYRSWIMPSVSSVEIDFCFGVVMNHCEKPVSLDIYLDVPNRNLTYRNRVTHDELLKIPGGSFHTPSIQKVETFLHFHMLKNGSYVNFTMSIRLKLIVLGKLSVWPSGLQRVLVPEEKIPVPPCKTGNTDISQPKPPPVCHPPHWRKNGSQSPPSALFPKEKTSETYQKLCNDSFPCGETEACNQETGRCECYPQFKYDSSLKVCEPLSQFGKSCHVQQSNSCGFREYCKQIENQAEGKGACTCVRHTSYDQLLQTCINVDNEKTSTDGKKNAANKPGETSSNAAAVTIGCLVVIIVVVAVIAAIYFIIRRKRKNYDRRVLLVNDDDDPLAM